MASSSRLSINRTGTPTEASANPDGNQQLKRKHEEDTARDEELKRSRVTGEKSGQIDNPIIKGQCLRIQNVPLAWGKDDLLACLQKAHPSLNNLDLGELSLYPACSSSARSQTALLNAEEPLAFFASLRHNKTIYIPVSRKTSLEVDSHFAALTPLNTPEGNIVADIIAVTGIGGHPFGSWRNRETLAMWLQDFLPNEKYCKNARILTYGYNTRLIGNDTVEDTILDYARDFIQQLANARESDEEKRRNIIFIGHSFGGIVILQLLTQAKNKPRHKDILDSTKAILFFGTPHTGFETSHLIRMVKHVSGVEESSSRATLLDKLSPDSEFLRGLRDELAETLGKLHLYSFYETKKTPTVVQQPITGVWGKFGPEVKMVQPFSALLHLPLERQIPISRNHSDMVKFSTETDKDYRTVVTCVGEIVKSCVEYICGGRAQGLCKQEDNCSRGGCRGKERTKILQWISNVPFMANHAFHREKRNKDTGYWLMENEKYRTWGEARSSMIWLRGDAGSGKTILASGIIDHFRDMIRDGPGTAEQALAYFYCNYQEEARKDPASIFRAVIKQLCLADREAQGGLPEPVLSIYRKRQSDGNLSCPLDLKKSTDLIIELSSRFSQTTIIIDALDECNRETRVDLFRMLKKIYTSTTRVRIFVTGRCDGDILQMLHGFPSHYIEACDNTRDIITYVNTEIERCYQEGQIQDLELKAEIISALVNRADGMFIWVYFQILAICATGRVRNTLATLPRGMNDTYLQILERIANLEGLGTLSTVHTILKWILYAKCERGCSLVLITEVLSIKPGEDVRDSEEWTLPIILNICQNLVVYDEELNTFRFAHFSVQEFLERQLEFNHQTAHTSITEVCLTSLLYHFDKPTVLYEYATHHWAAHLGLSSFQNGLLGTLWKMFLTPSLAYTVWGRNVKNFGFEDSAGEMVSPLWIACFYQLYDILKILLRDGADLSGKNIYMQTPLWIAAEQGFTSGVKLLVEISGIDLNCVDISRRTPLNCAANAGYEKVVQLLLEATGVDVNRPGKYGWTPLYSAVWGGHEKAAQLLLNSPGVDVNRPDEYGYTPLHIAVWGGHEKVVQLLLNSAGVDVNRPDEYGLTPLLCASRDGHEKVVQLLLETTGVDVNRPDEYGCTPLHIAVCDGQEKVVQLLLNSARVDVNRPDEYGCTPLKRAVCEGHEKVVQLLLNSARVDVNRPDKDGYTPLYWAVYWRYEKVVQLLLETCGVNLNVHLADEHGQAPLFFTTKQYHDGVLQLLRRND